MLICTLLHCMYPNYHQIQHACKSKLCVQFFKLPSGYVGPLLTCWQKKIVAKYMNFVYFDIRLAVHIYIVKVFNIAVYNRLFSFDACIKEVTNKNIKNNRNFNDLISHALIICYTTYDKRVNKNDFKILFKFH